MTRMTTQLLTIQQAADRLRISRSAVYRLMADRRIAYVDAPGVRGRRIAQDALEEFVSVHTCRALQTASRAAASAEFDASGLWSDYR